MTKTSRVLRAALASVLLSSFAVSASFAQEFKWKIQSNVQDGEPGHLALMKFAEATNAMSAGRLNIQVFPVESIYPVADGLDAIGSGVVQAGVLTGAIYAGQVGPIGTLETGVPGSMRDPIERYNFFYNVGFLELAQEAFKPTGVHYLGPQLSSGWDLISTKPIKGPEDFNGLRVRAYGVEGDWFEAMGASASFFPASEIYTNLATGVVDAVRWASPAGVKAGSFQEVAKYLIQPSTIAAPNNFFAVNLKAWEGLPPDLQQILSNAAIISSLEYVALAAMKDNIALKEMEQQGMQVVEIEPEIWQAMEETARNHWRSYAEQDELAKRAVEMLDAYLVSLGRG